MQNNTPPQPSKKNSSETIKSNTPDDKQTEAGVGATGGMINQDFRQNHTQPYANVILNPESQQELPMPHELTAEWTVRAQLRFARAGDSINQTFNSNDPVNPVRVTYKWTTLDDADNGKGKAFNGANKNEGTNASTSTTTSANFTPGDNFKGSSSGVFRRHSSRSSPNSQVDSQKYNPRCSRHESIKSTNTSSLANADSAFSSSNRSNKHKQEHDIPQTNDTRSFYGTRCRSTCNITVSAVADFLPNPGEETSEATDFVASEDQYLGNCKKSMTEEEQDPFVFNTTASYSVLPENSFNDNNTVKASNNFAVIGKVCNVRDAVCQTSDTETKYFEERNQQCQSLSRSTRSTLERRDSRKSYDYRRSTAEGLLHTTQTFKKSINEGNSFMPSQTMKSASTSGIPSLLESGILGGVGADCLYVGSKESTTSLGKQKKANSADQQKKPRTVHIDVYCTGSEEEGGDQADSEMSSSSKSESGTENRKHDQESNSTFQTVMDNEQIRLRHQRITGQALPRRLAQDQQKQDAQHKHPAAVNSNHQQQQQQQQQVEESRELQLGHGITKSSTAEEVHESKQLLFRKHIGDQRAIKLQTLRQKYLRQASDDAASLGYPSSTRSTVRDNTCSSMSSVVAGHDMGNSSWNDNEELDDQSYTLAKSDSFEYENALDRLRIKQMERLWSRSTSHEDCPKKTPSLLQEHPSITAHHHGNPHANLQTISENSLHGTSLSLHDTLATQSQVQSEIEERSETDSHQKTQILPPSPITHFPRNRPGFLQFFGPQQLLHLVESHSVPMQDSLETNLLHPDYQKESHILQRWKSETRENLSYTGTPAVTPNSNSSRQCSPQPNTIVPKTSCGDVYISNFQRGVSEAPITTTSAELFGISTLTTARHLEMHQYYHSATGMEASDQPPPVGYSSEHLEKAKKFGQVVPQRKPGHHVGPTKNPTCSCDSCQRWLSNRFQIRGRAFSLGETRVLKNSS